MAKKKKSVIQYGRDSNEKRDYQKFYVPKPDSNFNPEYNNSVIQNTIAEYEKMRRSKHNIYLEKLAERVDAAVSYVMYLERGGSSPAEKYFGKRILAQLRGQKIRRIVKGKTSILLDSEEDYIVS